MRSLEEKSASLRARLTAAPPPRPLPVDAAAERGADALPVTIRSPAGEPSLAYWLERNGEALRGFLHSVGGVLFRGFRIDEVEAFREVCLRCIDGLMPYNERSTPRSEKGDRIYTSTAYPNDQTIVLHNEFSYALAWPMRICFYAHMPSPEGGETPIADGRRVYAAIPVEVRDAFERKGVMYVRRYGWGVDLSWQETFGTEDPAAVEAYCSNNDIACEWDGAKLTTRQVRPATTRHPVSGETVWFNQAHLFHPTNLPEDVYLAMRRVMNGLFPREALYGDGTPIEAPALRAIHAAFDAVKVVFRWEKNDVLLLDNVLVNHGRNPYRGERAILVAMGQPFGAGSAGGAC